MAKHNEWLSGFKKDADRRAIENDITKEVEKRHLEGFVSCELHEYITANETFRRRKDNPFPSQGYMRKIRSFQIVVSENNRDPLDGVFALITSPGSTLTSEQMISAYREKYLIESAFREMKSVLKLRPWFVYKMEHVRAHYTICVLAYYLERVFDLMLEKTGLKNQGYTLARFKEELSHHYIVDLEIGSKKTSTLQKISSSLESAIKTLGLQKVLKPKF